MWYWSNADGTRLAYLARVMGRQVLVADGIPSAKYEDIHWYTVVINYNCAITMRHFQGPSVIGIFLSSSAHPANIIK